LPGSDPQDIFWGYNFLTGALTLSPAETGRLGVLSDGLCRSTDVAALKARLGPFVVAGLQGLVRRLPVKGTNLTPAPGQSPRPALPANARD
jgi:hypothetical protein